MLLESIAFAPRPLMMPPDLHGPTSIEPTPILPGRVPTRYECRAVVWLTKWLTKLESPHRAGWEVIDFKLEPPAGIEPATC
jgi:hypothetical protein